jgi:hypothetical protein
MMHPAPPTLLSYSWGIIRTGIPAYRITSTSALQFMTHKPMSTQPPVPCPALALTL